MYGGVCIYTTQRVERGRAMRNILRSQVSLASLVHARLDRRPGTGPAELLCSLPFQVSRVSHTRLCTLESLVFVCDMDLRSVRQKVKPFQNDSTPPLNLPSGPTSQLPAASRRRIWACPVDWTEETGWRMSVGWHALEHEGSDAEGEVLGG